MENKNTKTADIVIAFKYGLMISLLCSIVFFLGGFLFQGFTWKGAVTVWRGGMCVLTALGLFLVAGSILTKKSSRIKEDSGFRRKFGKLGYEGVIGAIALVIMLFAVIADAVLFII